jgi:D-alanine-D-alanine ligase-like ATP-grasp enzyme
VIRSAVLPAEIAQRCHAVTETLGLALAGIDLRLGRDGRWWCFEVNTAPGFIWFERHTGQPIAAAVARLLAGAAAHPKSLG